MKNNKYFKIVLLLLSIGFIMSCAEKKKESFNLKEFISEVNEIELSENKEKFVKEFIENNKFPIFENDSTAVFFYNGKRDSVGIIGDMTDWTETKYFTKIEDTDLFYLKEKYESDARLEYWLMFGKKSFPSIDSLNSNIILNGFGQISELRMPDYKLHKYFKDCTDGKKGSADSLKYHSVKSDIMPYEHDVHVYLPPNYNDSSRYNTIYFQDGLDYIEFALTCEVLDKMITDEKIVPLIGVFVTPPNRHQPKFPNRMTEYGLNDDYVEFFTTELVDFIDGNYNTIATKESRLVIGDSYGGLISLYIGFKKPDVFKNVYSQSGYHSFQKNNLINQISKSEKKDLKIYQDSGTYERNVGASFLPDGERDFLVGNRMMNEELKKKGYNHIYKEYPEGHTWGNWRRHLIDALIYFYGKNK